MSRRPAHATVGLAMAMALAAPAVAQTAPRLLPLPQSVVAGAGSITIADGATVSATVPEAGAAARLLVEHVRIARGLTLTATQGAARIRFERSDAVTGDEAYRLIVAPDGIRILAAAPAGFVHGAMTLVQLLSPDAKVGAPVRVRAMTIADAPRFAWRGLLVDPVRHFQPLPVLRRIIDQMAAVKLNTLHLHLTDDQGWRFEVKRYPKLTEVGAWRFGPGTGGAPPTQRVGGFYTQDELRALVAYAAERGITIVPEIDLPGHAQALVAAYPDLGIMGDRPAVSNEWGVMPYLFNPGPKGIAFVKEVLDELLSVFPGTYIHLGGDEAVKDQWQRNPVVQAQIRALGLKDENALQSWMIEQFGAYLAAKGRRLIGWDEILEGGLPPSASVMSWRGEQGAVAAANQNHDVVLSPAPILYLDNLQSGHGDEPPGRPAAVHTLADVYGYDPMPMAIDPAKAHHVLGAQMNAWSEYLVTPWQVEHAIFPRIAALAENSWSTAPRDFPHFLDRLQPQMARWRRAGVEVADSATAVEFRLTGTRGDALRANRITVSLGQQAPYGTIRYTTDGSEPGRTARRYTAPLTMAPGATIRAAAFDAAGERVAAVRDFATTRTALLAKGASDFALCPADNALALRVPLTTEATGETPAYNVNLFDTCIAYPAAPMDLAAGFEVDVARLARNWGLAHDFDKVRRHYNVTPHGELLVLVGCQAGRKGPADPNAPAPVIAGSFPLPDPATAPQRMRFAGTFPAAVTALGGDRDICVQFTSPVGDPFYAVERVQLTERR